MSDPGFEILEETLAEDYDADVPTAPDDDGDERWLEDERWISGTSDRGHDLVPASQDAFRVAASAWALASSLNE